MLSKPLLAILLVVVAQALELRTPVARQDPSACCTASNEPHTWSHAKPSPGANPFEDSQATMQCNFEQGTVTVNVKSPPETTHVEISALHQDNTRDSTENHVPYETDECRVSVDKPAQIQPWIGDGNNIDIVYDDPYAQKPLVDLSADYAAQWQKADVRRSESGDSQSVLFTADSKRCGSVRSRGAFVEGPECYKRGQIVVAIKEFIKVDDIIELVTITHLSLSCGVSISQPSNTVPAQFVPEVTTDATAKCQTSSYSVTAEPDSATEKITVNVTANVHPHLDSLVGWQIDQLKYAEDSIVAKHASTDIGNEIETTIQNSVQGGQISAWTSNPAAYRVVTDIVSDPAGQVNIAASINYCASTGSSELICVDPSVPTC